MDGSARVNYRELGYKAMKTEPEPDFTALGEAFAVADRGSGQYIIIERLEGVYTGALRGAVDRTKDGVETVHRIMTFRNRPEVEALESIIWGFLYALQQRKFKVAESIVSYAGKDGNVLSQCMFWTVLEASKVNTWPLEAKISKDDKNGFVSIFHILIYRYPYNSNSERMLPLVKQLISLIRVKDTDKEKELLEAILSILVGYVVLPPPLNDGERDAYEEAREQWVKVRITKTLSFQDASTLPNDLIKSIITTRTRGLDTFCTQCHRRRC